jgi:cytochrome b pre-mRNA-processing protein 3
MLRFLFRRLTNEPPRGQQMFDAAVAEARQAKWYREGGVPDTLDGRFAMLTTVCALVTVRLESVADGTVASAALTERFIEAMDAEHRQLGLNDPTLGKRVRKMVAVLARRVGEWRTIVEQNADWAAATRSSVYRDAEVAAERLAFTANMLRELWERLHRAEDRDLLEGRF